jgi:uncharacterized protein YjiS (DUF1127 family)
MGVTTMSMISSTATEPAMSRRSGGLIRWLSLRVLALAAHRERRAAIKTLLERDDRELRDIGLLRSQIEDAVGGALNPAMGRLQGGKVRS